MPAAKRLENRRAQRHQVTIPATLNFDRKVYAVTIKDISKLGARLHGPGPWARGDEVVLEAHDVPVVATVVWSDGEFSGINFHRAINPSTFLPDGNAGSLALSFRLAQQMEGGPTASIGREHKPGPNPK